MKIIHNIFYSIFIYFIGLFLLSKNFLPEFYILALSYLITFIIYLFKGETKNRLYNVLLIFLVLVVLPKFQYDYELKLFIEIEEIEYFRDLSTIINSYILNHFSALILIFFLQRLYRQKVGEISISYFIAYVFSIFLFEISSFYDLFTNVIKEKSNNLTTILFILQIIINFIIYFLLQIRINYKNRITRLDSAEDNM